MSEEKKLKNTNRNGLFWFVLLSFIFGFWFFALSELLAYNKLTSSFECKVKASEKSKKEKDGEKKDFLVGSRFSDFGIDFNDGVWNGDYWLFSSVNKERSLVKYEIGGMENLSSDIQGEKAPKVFWNGQYWLILSGNDFPKNTFLYRYDGKKEIIDLSSKQVAFRLDQAVFLNSDKNLWLLGGMNILQGKNNGNENSTQGKIIFYNGSWFRDYTSNLKNDLGRIAGVNLVSGGEDQWFVQIYRQGEPRRYSSYIVSREGESSVVDLQDNLSIRTIEWAGDRWFIGLEDGSFFSYSKGKLESIDKEVEGIKIVSLQASDQGDVLIFGRHLSRKRFNETIASSLENSDVVSVQNRDGRLFLFDQKEKAFKKVEFQGVLKDVYWDDDQISYLCLDAGFGTIGYSYKGWIISGKAGDKNKTFYLDSEKMLLADISLNVQEDILQKAVWNGLNWLLFGRSNVYKFIPGEWIDQLPERAIITNDGMSFYLIENNRKRFIENKDILAERFGWSDVIFSQNINLDDLEKGEPINTFPDGSFVSFENDLYKIENGLRRKIKNKEEYLLVFPELKNSIFNVSFDVLSNHQLGKDMDFEIPMYEKQKISGVFISFSGDEEFVMASTTEGVRKIFSGNDVLEWQRKNGLQKEKKCLREVSFSESKKMIIFSSKCYEVENETGMSGVYSVEKGDFVSSFSFGRDFNWSFDGNLVVFRTDCLENVCDRLNVFSVLKNAIEYSFPGEKEYEDISDLSWENGLVLKFSALNNSVLKKENIEVDLAESGEELSF